MARLGAIARDLTLATADLAPDQISRALAVFAKQALAEAIGSRRASPRYVKFVDGREGASEESVRADGVIRYEFDYLAEIVQFAMDTLFDLSPVDSGDYRNSHTIFLDRRPVRDLKNHRPGQEVVILNTVPYTRKIEVGAMKMRVAPGIYQKARQKVIARFGNFVSVELKFLAIDGGYVLKGRRKRKRKDTSAGQPLTYPALVINSGAGGF